LSCSVPSDINGWSFLVHFLPNIDLEADLLAIEALKRSDAAWHFRSYISPGTAAACPVTLSPTSARDASWLGRRRWTGSTACTGVLSSYPLTRTWERRSWWVDGRASPITRVASLLAAYAQVICSLTVGIVTRVIPVPHDLAYVSETHDCINRVTAVVSGIARWPL